jgi:hypothetical protein
MLPARGVDGLGAGTATPSMSSRTRRHTRLRRGAKPAVARLWPSNRLMAYLARSSSAARRISQPDVRGDRPI